jgi:2-iminobutanoate/2-iminopropanoate deaminase
MLMTTLRAWLPAFLIVPALSASLVAQDKPPQVTYIAPSGAAATLPFSPGVRVGHMLYLAGQLGTDSTNRLVPGGIEAETRQTLTNIKVFLEANGSGMDRVVRCLVMLADIAEWGRMNSVYVTFFPGPKPARSAMGASGLALGARVEIECTATVR